MAAVGRQAEREVASFDEGELWCADDALPPVAYRPGDRLPAVDLTEARASAVDGRLAA